MRIEPKEFLNKAWRAQADDLIGGWCVTLAEDIRTPAEGAIQLADFTCEEWAMHVANLHNEWLKNKETNAPSS